MDIQLNRRYFTEKSTIGELYIDTFFQCFTLEDRIRAAGVKVPKLTAIPEGTYKVVFDYSEKYGKLMPKLLDVPNFTFIRIHPGNYDYDTEGCILVGQIKSPEFEDKIEQSRDAFNIFSPKLKKSFDSGEKILITIKNVNPPKELIAV